MIPRIPDDALEELRRILLAGYMVAVHWGEDHWCVTMAHATLDFEATWFAVQSPNLRNALLLAEAGAERRIAEYCKDSKVSA
jgi:hypothetical protein